MKLRPLPPEQVRLRRIARFEFQRARRDGRIVKQFKCERCGRRQKRGAHSGRLDGVEAHHPDYEQPLRVEWLCYWCHLTADLEVNDRLKALPEPVVSA